MDKVEELKILGEVIRDFRIEKNLSQGKLGLIIFKDQQSIHKVETGQFNPTYIYLLEICNGLGISIDDLMNKVKEKKSNL